MHTVFFYRLLSLWKRSSQYLNTSISCIWTSCIFLCLLLLLLFLQFYDWDDKVIVSWIFSEIFACKENNLYKQGEKKGIDKKKVSLISNKTLCSCSWFILYHFCSSCSCKPTQLHLTTSFYLFYPLFPSLSPPRSLSLVIISICSK